jgi:hypothetical protein
MWSQLFTGKPRTVFDAYGDYSDILNRNRSNQLANALNQIKLQHAPQMAQSAEDLAKANVTIKQSDAAYEPRMNAADLSAKYLNNQKVNIDNAIQNVHFKALPSQIQAELLLKKAQTDQIIENTKLAPMKAQTQQTHFGNLYGLTKWWQGLSKAQKAIIQSQNPELVNRINQGAMNAAATAVGVQPGANPNQMMPPTAAPQQNIGASNSMSDIPNGLPDISANVPPAGAPDTSQSMTPPPDLQSPPQNGAPDTSAPNIMPQNNAAPTPVAQPTLSPDVELQQFGAQVTANKSGSSPQAYRQFESAAGLENYLENPRVDRLVKNAAKFAGIAGKGKAALDALSRDNPQEYADYLEFHNNFSTTMANLNRRLEMLGVQNETRQELLGNITKAFNASTGTPERALDQWNRLRQSTADLTRSFSKIAQPFFPGALEKHLGLNVPGAEKMDNANGSQVRMVDKDGNEFDVPPSRVNEAIKDYNWKRKD